MVWKIERQGGRGIDMCGRFVGFRRLEELIKHFPIDVADVEIVPSYNIAPTQEILAITRHDQQNHLEKLHWGLVPFWAKDKPSAAG